MLLLTSKLGVQKSWAAVCRGF